MGLIAGLALSLTLCYYSLGLIYSGYSTWRESANGYQSGSTGLDSYRYSFNWVL